MINTLKKVSKKGIFLFVLMVSFLMVFSVSALADPAQQISTLMIQIVSALKPIFVDLPQHGDYLTTFLKASIFFLIFTLIFYALHFVFHDEQWKRIRMIIAILIALISVIMVPANVVLTVAFSYTIVSLFILLGIPIFLLILLLRTPFFSEKTRGSYVARAVVFYLLATLVHNIVTVGIVSYVPTQGQPGYVPLKTVLRSPPITDSSVQLSTPFDSTLQDWLGFAEVILLILSIWYVIAAIFGIGVTESSAGSSTPATGGSWIGNMLNRGFSGGGVGVDTSNPLGREIAEFFNEVQQIERLIQGGVAQAAVRARIRTRIAAAEALANNIDGHQDQLRLLPQRTQTAYYNHIARLANALSRIP